jgi:hypothetical protein
MKQKQPWKEAKIKHQLYQKAINNELIYEQTTPKKGRGIFAKENINKGQLVCLFKGKPFIWQASLKEGEVDPISPEQRNFMSNWCMSYKNNLGLMPDVNSIGGHVANNSCEPNCEEENSSEENAIGLYATRKIKKDEEITISYRWVGPRERPPCLCESKSCIGLMHIPVYVENGKLAKVEELFQTVGKFYHYAKKYDNINFMHHIMSWFNYVQQIGSQAFLTDAKKEAFLDGCEKEYLKTLDI